MQYTTLADKTYLSSSIFTQHDDDLRVREGALFDVQFELRRLHVSAAFHRLGHAWVAV